MSPTDPRASSTPAITLWILSLNYAPEPTGFAPHATVLAEHFAARGHAVTVVTGFPFAPRWKRWPEYRGMFRSHTVQNGVTLERVTHFIPRRPGAAWQRLLMEATFCAVAAAALAPRLLSRRRRPDAVLYIGAQPAIAMLSRWLARASGAAFVANINDIASQAAADVGIVRAGAVQSVLERFEFSAYLAASGASVLCRSFADALVARGYPAARIRLIRSPVDLARIRPVAPAPGDRERLGLSHDAFVVLFAGSMGLKQGLTNVVQAAVRLQSEDRAARPIVWVLVGEGEMRAEILAEIDRHGVADAVRVLPFQPEDQMDRMFAAADVLLLNQLASVKDTVIPSKLLTYMAAGRPVLAAVNAASQGADILRESDGGLLVPPEDPAALARGAQAMMHDGAERLAAMGRRNRDYAEQHFDQNRITAQHEAFVLEQVTGR